MRKISRSSASAHGTWDTRGQHKEQTETDQTKTEQIDEKKERSASWFACVVTCVIGTCWLPGCLTKYSTVLII